MLMAQALSLPFQEWQLKPPESLSPNNPTGGCAYYSCEFWLGQTVSGARQTGISGPPHAECGRDTIRKNYCDELRPREGRFEYAEMKLEQSRQMFCHVDPNCDPQGRGENSWGMWRASSVFVQSLRHRRRNQKSSSGAAIKVDLQSRRDPQCARWSGGRCVSRRRGRAENQRRHRESATWQAGGNR